MAEKFSHYTTDGIPVADYHYVNLPESPGNTINYHGWVETECSLVSVKVLSIVANTAGTLVLTITNEATGNTVLSTANININSTLAGTAGVLTDDTLYTATLTSTGSDLSFSAGDRWKISLASDNAGMDASGIYVSLLFGGD